MSRRRRVVLAQQRQASILDRVRRTGGARVADLVRVLGVSDMTIRRDIEALAERGLVAKVHGGAVAVGGTTDEAGHAGKARQQRIREPGLRTGPPAGGPPGGR